MYLLGSSVQAWASSLGEGLLLDEGLGLEGRLGLSLGEGLGSGDGPGAGELGLVGWHLSSGHVYKSILLPVIAPLQDGMSFVPPVMNCTTPGSSDLMSKALQVQLPWPQFIAPVALRSAFGFWDIIV